VNWRLRGVTVGRREKCYSVPEANQDDSRCAAGDRRCLGRRGMCNNWRKLCEEPVFKVEGSCVSFLLVVWCPPGPDTRTESKGLPISRAICFESPVPRSLPSSETGARSRSLGVWGLDKRVTGILDAAKPIR
jgi:hypothetical protein